jgi:methylglutaconyl-CoA hydratase
MSYSFLSVRRDGPVEYVTLNRPDVRNAFNEQVIADLTAWARSVADAPGLRAAVLAGAGPVFSAGADAAWMAKMAGYSLEENVRDARNAASMFFELDRVPIALIGRVHGAALGGGVGLAAICDIVVASDSTVFGLTETKLGILPAMIAPYVLRKIGASAARELFLTGMRFSAERAQTAGLVHQVVPETELDQAVQRYVSEILTAAPSAVAAAKALIPRVAGRPADEVIDLTAQAIAAQRVSADGQEGLHAYLQKRRPGWVPS